MLLVAPVGRAIGLHSGRGRRCSSGWSGHFGRAHPGRAATHRAGSWGSLRLRGQAAGEE